MANGFRIIWLLIQFILIKIGQAEIWIVRLLVINPIRFVLGFRIPKIPQYQLPTPQILPRGRGRPRKDWFVPFYWNRFKLHLKRRVPRKTKIAVGLAVLSVLLYFYTSFIFVAAYQLPSPEKLITQDKALTTEFFDRNGQLLYRMYEGRNRILVELNELPSYLIQATIATEDKNFFKHPGIDIQAVGRAIMANLKKHPQDNNLEGASTITQQLIKNSLLTPEKTYTRKLKEMILALWAERMYSKDQVLKMYFNEAPYGGPRWGIGAAAETYFGVKPAQLSLAQAAFLAGLPASPTQFSPYGSNPELGKDRQKEVLRRMVAQGFITQHQADQAVAEDLHIKPPQNNIKAPHFVMYVKDELSKKYGQRAVSQGGLKIITTLDLGLQEQVERQVEEEVDKLTSLNVSNGAAMVTDASTGQILTMVGSKNYHHPQFGAFNVTTAPRQPGSSIKVVTYATAFKQGFSPGNTILDVPHVFRDEWGNDYAPQNYDGAFHGAVSIRQALGSSYNVTAVKLLHTLGLDAVVATARDMGITTFTNPKRYGLSLTLGGAEVKMVDMMTVYGSLSQMGHRHTVTPILKVTDSAGIVLEEYENKPIQTLQPEVAYLITDILTDNNARKPAFGENSQLKIPGKTVAVKTGTSDNKRDNWTCGYTPKIVVCTWVGNNNNYPMHPSLTSGVTGAAPMWHKIISSLLAEKGDKKFDRPQGIVEARVDGRKDLAIVSQVPKSLTRVSQKDNKQVFTDPYSSFASPSAALGTGPSAQQQAAIEGTRN